MTALIAGPRTRALAGVRRCLDVAIAGMALIVLGPVLVALVALVRLTSRGPALYTQVRVGRDARTFRMYKLRTMRHQCDDGPHREYVTRLLTEDQPPAGGGVTSLFKLQRDPRVTAVGRLLRRTSLDELPQLINVLKGDMAIVGPRPALPYEADLYQPAEWARFDVRPGITGLWQVSGRGRLTMREALALDIAYVEQQSLRLDLVIMVRTVPALFSRSGTS